MAESKQRSKLSIARILVLFPMVLFYLLGVAGVAMAYKAPGTSGLTMLATGWLEWTPAADQNAAYDTRILRGAAGTVDVQGASAAQGKINVAEIQLNSGRTLRLLSGSGTPEGAITAVVGSLYLRTNGGAATALYVKESGSGNTGWVAYRGDGIPTLGSSTDNAVVTWNSTGGAALRNTELLYTTGLLTMNGTKLQAGTGSPESVVTAPVGSLFFRTNGAEGTTLYTKATGSGNTGWVTVGGLTDYEEGVDANYSMAAIKRNAASGEPSIFSGIDNATGDATAAVIEGGTSTGGDGDGGGVQILLGAGDGAGANGAFSIDSEALGAFWSLSAAGAFFNSHAGVFNLNDGGLTNPGTVTFSTGPTFRAGSGTPEGSVTAPVGSLYLRSNGGTATSLYVKEAGSGNTGWVALGARPSIGQTFTFYDAHEASGVSNAVQATIATHSVMEHTSASADSFTDFVGVVPAAYNGGSITVEIRWAAHGLVSGAAVLGVQFENCGVGQDLDGDGFAAGVTATTTTSSTDGDTVVTTITLTNNQADLIVANVPYRLREYRDADAGGDTLAGALQVLSVSWRE